MTKDWMRIRILTGLGIYLLTVSVCSLVISHQKQEIPTSDPANLDIKFDKGELCLWD